MQPQRSAVEDDSTTPWQALGVAVLVGAVVGASVIGVALGVGPVVPPRADGPDVAPAATGLESFESATAFREYVGRYGGGGGYHGATVARMAPGAEFATGGAARATDLAAAGPGDADAGPSGDGGAAGPRYSGTNVQEVGIAEPDVLKSDGQTIYYAPRAGGVVGPEPRPVDVFHEPAVDDATDGDAVDGDGVDADTVDGDRWIPPQRTQVVSAADPADPALVGAVNETGPMFLVDETLVVLAGDDVVGYDVSSPAEPTETWRRAVGAAGDGPEVATEARVVTAREIDGTIYLVLRQRVSPRTPCPLEPLDGAAVRCGDVLHPTEPTRADATVSVVSLSAATGEVRDTATFLGSYTTSAVYVSADSIYVTYPQVVDDATPMLAYLRSPAGSQHLDAATVDRLDELADYDLTPAATRVEARAILETSLRSLPEGERRSVQEAIQSGFRSFLAEHQRELTRTGIVRVDTGSGDGSEPGGLSVAATGSVPGRVLNQFSMDQHEGHLRIATSVPAAGDADSANDLYVLDRSLSVTGSVQGMGLNERIYSVRFVGDRGYVVTFRRIDPFHVLDLSNPSAPELEGELKLPGFSSYLHPLAEDRVLGIGEEDGQVKAVTFDVSTPTDPTVEDSLVLPDRYSAVSESHHAFLQDERHEVVFVPGSRGGHVISYADGGLETVTTVETPAPPDRAMYVGDHLYVFSSRGLVVVDETDWSREATLSFAAS